MSTTNHEEHTVGMTSRNHMWRRAFQWEAVS